MCRYQSPRESTGKLSPLQTFTRRSVSGSQACRERGSARPDQSAALATAARIWVNHHCARAARAARRRMPGRGGQPLKPSSSCWFDVIIICLSFDDILPAGVGHWLSNLKISANWRFLEKGSPKRRKPPVLLPFSRLFHRQVNQAAIPPRRLMGFSNRYFFLSSAGAGTESDFLMTAP